jgi:Protein of unknown function (DUF2752)
MAGVAPTARSRSEVQLPRDPDEQQLGVPRNVDLGRRALRAGGVLAAWVFAALPVALGWQTCTFATLLHRPCPGCGMTRAVRLMQAGDVAGSLRMHPLALPVLAAGALIVLSTVVATLDTGTPIWFYRQRLGRLAIAFAVVVYAAALVLWILRWFGLFGGPVAVY